MVHLKPAHVVAAAIAVAAAGCIPNVSVDDALVTTPRVLAIRSSPAEAPEGAHVQWEALYATPAGTDASPIQWDLCVAATPLTTIGPISATCLATSGPAISIIGEGATVSGTIPSDACRVFGPDAPVATATQPAGRPVDPDATGGYYQPIIAHTNVATLGETRISCGVAGATAAVSVTFTQEYVPNRNPVVASLLMGPAGGQIVVPTTDSAETASVKAGATIPLVVSWPACPSLGACDGAEQYVVYDQTSQQIVTQREAMHVSWFTAAGTYANQRGGVAATDDTTQVANSWTAPESPGTVTLWVVLVDDRGGTGWESYRIQVTP